MIICLANKASLLSASFITYSVCKLGELESREGQFQHLKILQLTLG